MVVMILACLASASVAITLLYQTAFEEERARLAEMTHTQARLMEAVARFDQQYSEQDHPEGSAAATLSQIIDAHKHNKGFGQTGEMTLARQVGDQIVWLLTHRHSDLSQPKPLPLSGKLAEPMRRALSGKAGTIVAPDYRGEIVLAAYEPVALLKLGLVSKIDIQEIRAPFIQAGVVTGIAGISIIMLGGFLLFQLSHPIIKQLEESEAYTRAIITHAGEGIITADETGTIETFNSTAERIFLYPAREVIGKKLGTLLPRPDNEHYQDYITSYLHTGERLRLGSRREVTAQRRDGTTFPLLLAVTEVVFSHRRLFIGLVHDLTEEKTVERRLRAQYEVARILAEQITIEQAAPKILQAVCECLGWQLGVLWQVDTQENFLQCIELWCSAPDQFTEFSETTKGTMFLRGQGLPGRAWETGEAVWIPDVVKDTNFPRATMAAKENLHAAFAFPIQFRAVFYGVMEFFSFHIHEPDDALLQQMQSVGSQIGQLIDRTQSQEKIKLLAKFPEENPNPVLRVLRDGTVTYHNKAATKFLSLLEPEIDQQQPSPWPKLIRDAFNHGSVQEQEILCHGRVFSLTLAVIDGTDYLNVYALDITDRRKAEAHLRNRDEQRRQMQKLEAIGTLAGGIAHDFNNILAALIGYTELAIAKAKTTPEAIASYLEEVLQAGQRAKNLVQQILTFSRQGDAGKKPIQLQAIVEEALKLLRASMPSTIAVKQDLESSAGPVFADPTQIHQVMMNLGTNAEYAMRGKNGTLHVTLNEITVDDNTEASAHPGLAAGRYVRFTMTDSGQGIPPDVLSRIFDPFFTTKGVGEGTGMGLAVTHGIVTDHEGAISVNSELGIGTTVVVYFPRTVEVPEEPSLYTPEIPRGKGTILYVDDETSILDSSKAMLEALGYRVQAYTNSREALRAFRQAPDMIDAVITDQTMPECTGAELAKEILQIRPSIPLILCTGFSHIMNEEKALSIGISVFLNKPYKFHELAQAVQHAFERSKNR
ncbi:MAG: hypothetical protein NPIRA02_42550 [Nitrospirales bacterium]|nr:MAG: hypothetical protein NPIRA02_42550 [Nitrospirales bacterium]